MRAAALPFLLLLALVAASPAGATDRTVSSGPTDQGYGDGRAWHDVNGDRRADYCRIVGGGTSFHARCSLATGDGFSGDRVTPGFPDPGYAHDRGYADADADGVRDFCRLVGNTGDSEAVSCTTVPKGETTTAPAVWGQPAGRAWIDFDGDGRTDFCRVVGADPNWQVACTRLNGTTQTSGTVDPGPTAGRAWADVDGDRKADFCRQVGSTAECLLGATGWSTKLATVATDMGYPGGRTWVDYDGDGKTDFCRYVGAPGDQEGVACTTSRNGALGPSVSSNGHVAWGTSAAWADFDGDGRLDFCRLVGPDAQSQKAGCVALLPGGGNAPFGASEPLVAGQETSRAWIDHDADGKADYCRVVGAGHDARMTCTISNGTDFTAPPPRPPPPPPAPAAAPGTAERAPGAAAPAPLGPRKLDVIVRTFWRVTRRSARLLSLRVFGLPAGGTVHVACKATRGCPYRNRAFTGPKATKQLGRPFSKRDLRAGARIEVRITAPGTLEKNVRWTVRRGRKAPKRVDF